MSGEATNEIYNFFTSRDEISHIHDKNLNFLFVIYKVKSLVFNVVRYRGLRGKPEFYYRQYVFNTKFFNQ